MRNDTAVLGVVNCPAANSLFSFPLTLSEQTVMSMFLMGILN